MRGIAAQDCGAMAHFTKAGLDIALIHGKFCFKPLRSVDFRVRSATPLRPCAVIDRDLLGTGDLEGEREHGELSARKRLRTHGPDAFEDYKAEKNAVSIDGLPTGHVEIEEPAE